jgi:RimJ/RimL family protein N-acetyltransferase
MFRVASTADLSALRDLERTANLAALGHVFPPERYPFPDDDVLARWALVLDEPGVDVLVLDDPHDPGALLAYAAYDDTTLRHLAVHPEHWGSGLATAAITATLDVMEARGAGEASLWCLEENRRARRLYEHLGWRATADRREAPWRPHPVEMRYVRPLTPDA